MDQPGNSRVAAKKQSPPVVAAPKSVEPMAAAGDIGPISAYEQLASLSADGRPDPAHVLALQRAAGNRAVSRFMAGRTVQTKVNTDPAAGRSASQPAQRARSATPVPAPGPGRREAGRSRARPAASPPASPVRPPIAQRIARLEDEEAPEMPGPRPGAGFDASPDFESRLATARGSGAPLPDTTRAFMEQRIGADFGGVKVHTDARSDALNQAIQAKAFTTGQDVFFRRGEFEPATSGGKELIAHELTHVVQQTGAVRRAPEPPTDDDRIPTLEEELIAEGAADPTTFTGPTQKSSGLAKMSASIKSAVRPGAGGSPVKAAIDKLDRAALDRIIDLISKDQIECTPQQRLWLGQRASAFAADTGSYETTLAKELAWEKAASIAALDRPGLERILRLIQDNKLKVKPAELQQLGRRRQALMADASTYETTLANELAFEQVKSISELDRDGLDRILTLIEDGKLMITQAERQQLGKRRTQVGDTSGPGEVTLADALAREGAQTIGALNYEGVERVVELVSEKKLRLEPAQRQQLGRRRSELEARGNNASKTTLAVALAREGAESISLLDLAGVDAIADLLAQKTVEATPAQIQELGERRRQLLSSAPTVAQYLKAERANGTQARRISDLSEGEAEALLERIEKKTLRATNQEIYDLSRFRKNKPAEREDYLTTFKQALAWEGVETAEELTLEAAERIRELVANKQLKVTTAELQQLASVRKAKPAPGAEKTTLEKELARHGAATLDDLDLEGIDAIRRLVAEKKFDPAGFDLQQLLKELGRRHKILRADQETEETTLEMEMARVGLGAQEFEKLDRDEVEEILALVDLGALKLGTETLLALGQQRLKAAPANSKTNLALEMARHGATEIEKLDLEGVEAILELTAAANTQRLEVSGEELRALGMRRKELLKKRDEDRLTLQKELTMRHAAKIEDLKLEAVEEVYQLAVEGNLKLLPSERESLERRRKQLREAAKAAKPKLEDLLAWEGAETLADLDFEAADKILNQIQWEGLAVDSDALRELVKRRGALERKDLPIGTLQEELANEGVVRIADLESGGINRIWGLIEARKLNVTNEQLLELARLRKADLKKEAAVETSLEEQLAEWDVDGIADLDLKGVTEIWKLVERQAIEIAPDQLRELASRRKVLSNGPRTYETTLDYELVKARVESIAGLELGDVASILERADAGELALTNLERAQLVRRQKEDSYDGRALKALLAKQAKRTIGALTPLTVSILLRLAEANTLKLSANQRRELNQRRKEHAADPKTLEHGLERVGVKSLAELKDRNKAQRVWTLALEEEITLEPSEVKKLAAKAGRSSGELLEHAQKETKRIEEALSAFEKGSLAQTGARRYSILENRGSFSGALSLGDTSLHSLRAALSIAGATEISELSLTEAENIISQIEQGEFSVTRDELRQLVRLRNDELKKRMPEATTLERELGLQGATTIEELDLEGIEAILGLVSEGQLKVAIEEQRELTRRRAEFLSSRAPEALTLETELARAGVVEIASLDAYGLQTFDALVASGDLAVTPAERRQLARRRKALSGPATTLAAALAAEGVSEIKALDFEGVERITTLIADNQLKVGADDLRQLFSRGEELGREPAERRSLVKELVLAQASSIAELDLDGVERIIELIDRGALKVDVDQRRALYQRDAELGDEDLDDVEQEDESTSKGVENQRALRSTTRVAPTGRLRSNALGRRDLAAELAQLGVRWIGGLDLAATQRLIGLIEDGSLAVETSERRRLYRRQATLARPQTQEDAIEDDALTVVLDEMEEGGEVTGTDEPARELPQPWDSDSDWDDALLEMGGRLPTTRQRSNALLGNKQSDLARVLARARVTDIASLDRAGAVEIKALLVSKSLRLSKDQAAQFAARWRELERAEALEQMTLDRALKREDAADIESLDLEGAENLRRLIYENRIKPMPGNDTLLKLGQRRKALLSQQSQARTTLEAELGKEKVKGIGDLELDGVERIRGLIAEKKIEVTPAELISLAQRRMDLLRAGARSEPTLEDELTLEGVDAIDALDRDGVKRIRDLVAQKQISITPEQINALGKRRMALLSGPDSGKTTLEAELALAGAATIADLDRAGIDRIRMLVGSDELDLTLTQLNALGLRSEALPPEAEREETNLEVELARQGVDRIADLDLGGVDAIRKLVNSKPPELVVTDPETEELRLRKAQLTEEVTLSAFLTRVGAPNIAGLGREAMIDIWALVEGDKLDATAAEIRELALKRDQQRNEVMKLSEYLADKRNARPNGRGARAIDRLAVAEIDAILDLIEEERLIAEPEEIKELARARKELRSAPRSEPTGLTGALLQEGINDIASLGLVEIQTLWTRVTQNRLEATPDQRKQLGRRRRELLDASRTLKAAVADAGAASIADLSLGDVLALWDRVASGELSADPEELRQLGLRRKSRVADSRTLAFELEKEGVKDIASLDPDAVERIWDLVEGGHLQIAPDALRELARRHKYETGASARQTKLEALEDLAGNFYAQRTIQARLLVGPVGDRYEQDADRVARQVVGAPAPEQPSDEYYRDPAYPSGRAPGRRVLRSTDVAAAELNVARQAGPPLSIQTKLTVGPVGDRYEQEADRVARQVVAMRMPDDSGDEYYSGSVYSSAGARGVSSSAAIPRSPVPIEIDNLQASSMAQRAGASFDAGVDFEERLGAARGGGAPLPDTARAFMEQRMGADFGGIRVHADAQSGQLNRMIQAKAFTMGSDVFFGRGEYNPDSSSGKELLAHELAHTVQQGAAPVQRTRQETEAPIAASEVIEADAEASAGAPQPAAEPSDPAAAAPAARLSPSSGPAAQRANMLAQIGGSPLRPVVQRHLLGSLADLGRSILSTLASIPENLWAALRPASGAAQAPLGPSTSGEEQPASLEREEAPPQQAVLDVAPPPIAQPAKSTEAFTQESIRAKVNLFDPTGGDVVRYISDRITEVGAVEDLLFVVSRERLVDALANDMAARSGGVPVDESHQQAAEREVANGGGGFTALDGRIFILDTAAKSSALFHEVIHVLSGPGGATPLAQLKMQLNEGFTNYFAEEVAGLVGGEVYAAYAFPTEWARKFAAAHGQDAAYNIYFKGNIDLLYEKMAGFLLKQAEANQLKESEANLLKLRGEWSMDKALAMVKTKVKGADFFDRNALPNLWFDGRVF